MYLHFQSKLSRIPEIACNTQFGITVQHLMNFIYRTCFIWFHGAS